MSPLIYRKSPHMAACEIILLFPPENDGVLLICGIKLLLGAHSTKHIKMSKTVLREYVVNIGPDHIVYSKTKMISPTVLGHTNN